MVLTSCLGEVVFHEGAASGATVGWPLDSGRWRWKWKWKWPGSRSDSARAIVRGKSGRMLAAQGLMKR